MPAKHSGVSPGCFLSALFIVNNIWTILAGIGGVDVIFQTTACSNACASRSKSRRQSTSPAIMPLPIIIHTNPSRSVSGASCQRCCCCMWWYWMTQKCRTDTPRLNLSFRSTKTSSSCVRQHFHTMPSPPTNRPCDEHLARHPTRPCEHLTRQHLPNNNSTTTVLPTIIMDRPAKKASPGLANHHSLLILHDEPLACRSTGALLVMPIKNASFTSGRDTKKQVHFLLLRRRFCCRPLSFLCEQSR